MKKKSLVVVMMIVFLVQHVSCICAGEEAGDLLELNKYPVPELKYKSQSLYADFFENHVFERLEKYLMLSTKTQELFGVKKEAQRVNAYDEVPDSTLFTNRNGRTPLSIEAIKRGADLGAGPDLTGKWVITKGKAAGRNPGFFIKDSRGDKYLIKLDRKKYPEMITSCEVIGSKFFHAIGYNVPQNTICYFDSSIITVAEDAHFYDTDGFDKQFTQEHAMSLLEESAFRNAQGKYRAVASKILSGVPKGYVSLRSSRDLCMNDCVTHQNRREMRAYKVFSSWLNHHDARRGNTLDMLIEEQDGWYLKQYLIDFGSCLGSHNMYGKYAEAGHTNVVDLWEMVKSWLSLGLYKKPYYRQVMPFSPAVGYITSDVFEPKKWKPMIPNFAFDNLTTRDAFWAAKIVMSFSNDQIKAIVATGDLSIKRDRDYLAKVIQERRDKVGEYWFSQINPLDNFRLQKSSDGYLLSFDNLYKKYQFEGSEKPLTYRYSFMSEGGNSEDRACISTLTNNTEQVLLPMSYVDQLPIIIDIETIGQFKKWKKPVSVTIDGSVGIRGIQRNE